MSTPRASQSWQYLVYFYSLVAVVLIGLQIWSAFPTSGIVSSAKQTAIRQIIEPDPRELLLHLGKSTRSIS